MIRKIIPHICIAISVMIIVFYIINIYNDAMGFLRGTVFETLLLIFCAVSITTSVMLLVQNERRE
ncbi:MAG: hypothetical protein PHO15_00725 [Eubacteriales bacterium]|nr:hypothetical protein [Eubacteriales bacterium]